jgi:osmotically-inducible protein OsmY
MKPDTYTGRGGTTKGREPAPIEEIAMDERTGGSHRDPQGLPGHERQLQYEGRTDNRHEPVRGGGVHYGKGPKGYVRPDSSIKDEIYVRLTDHHFIDASEIWVEVAQGEVTLTGNVERRSMRHAAEDVASDVLGVLGVINLLKVRSPGV